MQRFFKVEQNDSNRKGPQELMVLEVFLKIKMFIIPHKDNLQALMKCQTLPPRWEKQFYTKKKGRKIRH